MIITFMGDTEEHRRQIEVARKDNSHIKDSVWENIAYTIGLWTVFVSIVAMYM
jgi:hypothetical protein